MLVLLATTITASFLDSLNPSAIAQQMMLQAILKNKRYIWFFIFGIGLANFIMGIAVYYGIATHISVFLEKSILQYSIPIRVIEILSGAICIIVGIKIFINTKNLLKLDSELPTKVPQRKLTRAVLFFMGVAFCIVELTSALPYFGFLAVLTGYQLAPPYVTIFILLYTVIYILPLILLYFGYNRLQNTVLIARLEMALGRISSYILPVTGIILGIVLSINGIYTLIMLLIL